MGLFRADTLYAMNTRESAMDVSSARNELQTLDYLEVCSGPEPSASIVFLHGFGADGHDFEPLVPQLTWPGAPDIRFVLPHAAVRPVTVNGGMPMRAWCDVVSIDSERGHDEQGVSDSVSQIFAIIDRERERGIESDRIVLAGFSQGGAIALQAALRYPHRLAGLIVLSTYLLYGDRLESLLHQANRDIPVFAAHGSMDPVVPFAMGQAMYQRLRALAYPVQWHSYPMEHALCAEEVTEMCHWLAGRFG